MSMNEHEAEVCLSRLIVNVKTLIVLMTEHDGFWTTSLIKALAEINNHDAHGLDRLLSMYGGMGSFNDFVINTPSSGGAVTQLNNELNDLRTQIYEDVVALAMDLKRSGK